MPAAAGMPRPTQARSVQVSARATKRTAITAKETGRIVSAAQSGSQPPMRTGDSNSA